MSEADRDFRARLNRMASVMAEDRPGSKSDPYCIWPDLEPSPLPPPELHDYSRAWLGLVLLLLAFGAGWVVRGWA